MKKESKRVTAEAPVKIEAVLEIASRFELSNYQRPLAAREDWENLILNFCQGRELILDAACGVGESSFKLGLKYPDCAVLGVDKSASRVDRKNAFKKQLPPNVKIIKGDMLDIWMVLKGLVDSGRLSVRKQYILYPNPWPKNKGLKKRWYANPILPFIMGLEAPIEARSNWRRYLEDFKIVGEKLCDHVGSLEVIEIFEDEGAMTPFEKKYHESGQELFLLKLEKL